MTALDLAAESIIAHEGLRLEPYRCPAGKWTWGYGRNLEDAGLDVAELVELLKHGADERFARFLLDRDIRACVSDLVGIFPVAWAGMTASQKAALIDLRYCVGPAGFRSFRRMIEAVRRGAWAWAADEVLDSLFADQTGGRAGDLAEMMRR